MLNSCSELPCQGDGKSEEVKNLQENKKEELSAWPFLLCTAKNDPSETWFPSRVQPKPPWGSVPQQALMLLCEPSPVSHSWHPLSLVGSLVVSLSAKGTRAAPEKQLPLVFVPHGLPWPCAP